jgi:hypothetical protein
MRQETPERVEVSTPMEPKADTTAADTVALAVVGKGCPVQGPCAVQVFGRFGKQRGADGAHRAPGQVSAAGAWASASHVHEESQLVVNVEGRVSGQAEAHPSPAFALLVVFTAQSAEGGAPLKLCSSN